MTMNSPATKALLLHNIQLIIYGRYIQYIYAFTLNDHIYPLNRRTTDIKCRDRQQGTK